MNKTLVVLAAGMGSRYGGLKQIDPVGPAGECILDYSIFDALRAGFNKVVFVIRRDIEEAFKEHIVKRLPAKAHVAYVFQELTGLPDGVTPPPARTRPWGTGQALLAAQPETQSPFAVINADDFYGRDSFARLASFLDDTGTDPASYAMVGFPLANTLPPEGSVSRALCSVGPDGVLTGLTELPKIEQRTSGIEAAGKTLAGSTLVSMNMFGFKPSIFEHAQQAFCAFLDAAGHEPDSEFFMPKIVSDLIRAGTVSVQVLETDAQWFGVTNPRDKDYVVARLRELIDAGEYPKHLWG